MQHGAEETTPRQRASQGLDAPHRTGTRHRAGLTVWLIALAVLAADQLTKAWAVAALSDGSDVRVLGPLLGLRLVHNPGAAFSVATGQTWVLTLIAVAVVIVVARVSRRLGSAPWAATLGLVLGGALGNLVDRLVRSPGPGRGHVVDFIDYGVFVGNVADIAIVVAAGLIMWLTLTGRQLDGTRAGQGGAEGDGGTQEDSSQEGTQE